MNGATKFLFNLVIRPAITIKKDGIVDYNKEVMKRIFGIGIILYSIITSVLYNNQINGFANMLIKVFLISIGIYLGTKIVILFYYFVFKIIGKDIELSFNKLQLLMMPSVVIFLYLKQPFIILNNYFLNIDTIGNVIIGAWVSYILYCISKYTLKQSSIRSLFIVFVYPIINIYMWILSI